MRNVTRGEKLGVVILKALGIDSELARRVIVDCQVAEPVKVYIEVFGDEETLSLDWPNDLEAAKVTILEKQHGDTTRGSQGGSEGRTD